MKLNVIFLNHSKYLSMFVRIGGLGNYSFSLIITLQNYNFEPCPFVGVMSKEKKQCSSSLFYQIMLAAINLYSYSC